MRAIATISRIVAFPTSQPRAFFLEILIGPSGLMPVGALSCGFDARQIISKGLASLGKMSRYKWLA